MRIKNLDVCGHLFHPETTLAGSSSNVTDTTASLSAAAAAAIAVSETGDVYSNHSAALTTTSAVVPRWVVHVTYSLLEEVLFSLYLYVTLVITVVMNLIVLAAISRERRLHTPENIIIFADSINNLILTSTIQPFMLYVVHRDVIRPNYVLCQVVTETLRHFESK